MLHLLGFDHEISEEAEVEMEREEELLLKSLGWKGKGLIKSAYDAETNSNSHHDSSDGNSIFTSSFSSSQLLLIFWFYMLPSNSSNCHLHI